mmetsp:Transcript_19334/g.35098  ORF Transcript_19334/g.35098 Transcript_19334/m.35098 type:complete len:84 (+) Transcript_19334:495-746(+)
MKVRSTKKEQRRPLHLGQTIKITRPTAQAHPQMINPTVENESSLMEKMTRSLLQYLLSVHSYRPIIASSKPTHYTPLRCLSLD